jgi:hypothetical protein
MAVVKKPYVPLYSSPANLEENHSVGETPHECRTTWDHFSMGLLIEILFDIMLLPLIIICCNSIDMELGL